MAQLCPLNLDECQWTTNTSAPPLFTDKPSNFLSLRWSLMRTRRRFPKHHPHRPSLQPQQILPNAFKSWCHWFRAGCRGQRNWNIQHLWLTFTNRFVVSDGPHRRSDDKPTVQNTETLKSIESIVFLVVQCNQCFDQHFRGSNNDMMFRPMAKFDDATVLWPFSSLHATLDSIR